MKPIQQPMTDEEYDKKRKQKLLQMKDAGNMPDNLQPELEYLQGKRGIDHSWHDKAKDVINNSPLSISELSTHTNCSEESLKKIGNGDYNGISRNIATKAYYNLRSI